MATLYPKHQASAGGRGLSQSLWRGFPLDEIFGGPAKIGAGIGIFEDFDSFGSAVDAATTTIRFGPQGARIYVDTATTVSTCNQLPYSSTLTSSGAHGVLRMACGATDKHQVAIQWCGVAGAPFAMDDTTPSATADAARDLAFEVRLRFGQVADNANGLFVGLAEEAMTGDDALMTDDTGVLVTTVDLLGFNILQADGNATNWVHQVTSGGLVTTKAGIHVPVADTWYKYGFRYSALKKTITPFINGVENSNVVTSTATAAATFPDAVGMAPIIAVKTGGNTALVLDIDWICCAQPEATGGVGNF